MKDIIAVKERKRAAPRADEGSAVTVLRAAKLITGQGQYLCLARTISPAAMTADLDLALEEGERLFVEISGLRIAGTVVSMIHSRVEIRFESEIDVQAILAGSTGEEGGQRRTAPRVEVDCRARLQLGAQNIFVTVRDISQDGLRIESDDILFKGDEVAIALRGWGKPIRGTVRWTEGDRAGISFHEPLGMREMTKWLASSARPASDDSPDAIRRMGRQ